MALSSLKKVLVVDDDEVIREFVKELLLVNGCKVTEATNGKDGLKKFHEIAPDLVITDIIMPEMEGISFIRELRSYNQKIPIIAMTGNIHGRMEEFLELSSKLGADEILRKPIKPEELITIINKLI